MAYVTEYGMASASTPAALVTEVNTKIALGCQPWGDMKPLETIRDKGFTSEPEGYIQMLVKYEAA